MMAPDAGSRPTSLATTVLTGTFGVVGVYLLWMSLPWPLIHDAPIMHYVARRIAAGAVPYRDLFDMNQPGVYLLHLGIVRTLGDGDFAWRLFDLGWLALTAALIAAFAWRWGTGAAVGGAALFCVYHLSGGAWQAGQRDFVLCAFLLTGALLVAQWIEAERPSAWRLGAAGLALGAGVTLKPHSLLFAVALGLLAVVTGWRVPGSWRALALYGGGLVAPPLAVLGWLAARGGLTAWRDIVVTYLIPLYSRLTRPEDWRVWRADVWIPLGAVALLSLAAAVWNRRLTWRHGIVVLGIGYGLVHFVAQWKGWEYHLYPLAAFTALLAFSELDALVARRRHAVAGLVAATLVACVVLLAVRGVSTASAHWVWDKERAVRHLVADLKARLRPGDQIQVFDTTEGAVHALLRLDAREPTRFLYDFHFFHDVAHPTIQRLRAELAHDLAARPPRFIVVFERGWPAGGIDRFRQFPDLSRLLDTRYTVVQRRLGYVILEQRDRR
jgi:hypothetical protein